MALKIHVQSRYPFENVYICGMDIRDTYRMETLARLVGEASGYDDIFERRRTAPLVSARACFHYLAFTVLNMHLGDIARFSRRSYSIVYYDVVRFRENLRYDWRLRDMWARCSGIEDEIRRL